MTMIDTHTQQNISRLIDEAQHLDGKLIDFPRSFSSKSEMRDFYNAYGYITLKNVISEKLLSAIRSDLTDIFGPYATEKDNIVDSAILNLDRSDKPKLYELHIAASKCVSFKATSVYFSELLKDILGIDAPVLEICAIFLLSIAKDKRLVYDFHQESNFMKGFGDIFNFHYPLFRTSSTENGTMSILPSSHLFGTLSFNKSRIANDAYTNRTLMGHLYVA